MFSRQRTHAIHHLAAKVPPRKPSSQPARPESDHYDTSGDVIRRVTTAPESLSAADIVHLQRTIGNQKVMRLLNSGAPLPVSPGTKPKAAIQRFISLNKSSYNMPFDVKPLRKNLLLGHRDALFSRIDSYTQVAATPSPDLLDSLRYLNEISAAAATFRDALVPDDHDGPEWKSIAYKKQLSLLVSTCHSEINRLKPDVLKEHPEAITLLAKLGSGNTGSVYNVEGSDQIFKPDAGLFAGQGAAGTIGLAKKPGSPRAVASARLDKLIGTGVTGDAKLAISTSGHRGHLMDKASGKGLDTIQKPERLLLFQNSTVKKGLYNLQTLDALTGEADRNSGNIFIDDSSGQVTGIDNETAFSATHNVADMKAMVDSAATRLRMLRAYTAGGKFINQQKQHQMTGGMLNMSLPEYMDEFVASTIVGLSADDIVNEVQDLITDPAALDKLKQNFESLKAHAQRLLDEATTTPQNSKIIPSTPDDGGWAGVTTTSKSNYFYEEG